MITAQEAQLGITERIKERFEESVKDIKVLESKTITPKQLDKKGYLEEGSKGIDDYVQTIGTEIANSTDSPVNLTQANLTSNYFPIRYDPKIYDQGTLYGMTPYMTYMEARGRRAPTGYLTVNYMKWDTGFVPEWIAETANTSGGGAPDTSTATATVKYLAMPVHLSDIIGKGESRPRASQIMQFANAAMRQEFNQTLVSGDATATQEFDGILEVAKDSATRTNFSSTAVTIDDMYSMDAVLQNTLKTPSTACLTNSFVLNQVRSELMTKYRTGNVDVTVGINPIAFNNSAGVDIPIIVDPNVTLTGNSRRMLFFNENHVMIEDFLTPGIVPQGSKAGPFVSDFWITQVAVQYHVAPALMNDGYGIQ